VTKIRTGYQKEKTRRSILTTEKDNIKVFGKSEGGAILPSHNVFLANFRKGDAIEYV